MAFTRCGAGAPEVTQSRFLLIKSVCLIAYVFFRSSLGFCNVTYKAWASREQRSALISLVFSSRIRWILPNDYLAVTAYTRRMNDGITQPFLCTCQDSNAYIVKGRPKLRQSELAAEFISAHLARSLELAIPDFCVVDVGRELIEFMPSLRGQLDPGPAFATKYIEGCSTLNLQQARTSVNVQDQKRIFFFDRWINNSDRSLTEFGGNVNIIFDPLNNRYYLIDHNLSFAQAVEDEEYDVHVYSANGRAWFYDMMDKPELLDLANAAIASLDQVFSEIPDVWLPDGDNDRESYFSEIRTCLSRVNNDDFWSKII